MCSGFIKECSKSEAGVRKKSEIFKISHKKLFKKWREEEKMGGQIYSWAGQTQQMAQSHAMSSKRLYETTSS